MGCNERILETDAFSRKKWRVLDYFLSLPFEIVIFHSAMMTINHCRQLEPLYLKNQAMGGLWNEKESIKTLKKKLLDNPNIHRNTCEREIRFFEKFI